MEEIKFKKFVYYEKLYYICFRLRIKYNKFFYKFLLP